MNKILIIDAPSRDGRMMATLMEKSGYFPITADSFEDGKKEVFNLPSGSVIVASMRVSENSVKDFLVWLQSEHYRFPVLVVVDNLDAIDIIQVMEGEYGAVGIVQRKAIDKQLAEQVSRYVKPERIPLNLKSNLIPRKSRAWKDIHHKIQDIAATDANAIIFGECGSGKEQVANQVYLQSSRVQKPCVVVEAGGAPLIGKHNPKSEYSEIYDRIEDYFHQTEGGTMIIKNVHLLTFDRQSVLLHILENEHPNVRVICTAEPELLSMVASKAFRPNLFYILRQSDIAVPSLKETTEDIPMIADYLLKAYASKTGKECKHLDATAIKALKLYPWPGNVRELKDVLLFSAFHAKGDTISESDLNFNLSEPSMLENLALKNPQAEADIIVKAYRRAGSWRGAAKLLGISERALFERRKNLGIDKHGN